MLKSAFKKIQVESFEKNRSLHMSLQNATTKPNIPDYIMLNKIPESEQFEFLKSNSNLIFSKFFGLHWQFDSGDCVIKKYIIHCTYYFAGNFFPLSLVIWGHITSYSNNETVSRQNLWASSIAKSMTSEANSALLPGLMNFQLQNFQLYITNHFKTGPSGNSSYFVPLKSQCFPWRTLRFSGNKINSFSQDQT